MRDHDLLERIIGERGGFGHREHLELAWSLLGRHPQAEAHRSAARLLRYLAGQHGAPERYHETITASWIHLVALHRSRSPAASFDEFIAEHPALLDAHLLEHHYTPQLMRSDGARAQWAEPDLRPFPPLVV